MILELGFKSKKDPSPNSNYYNHHWALLDAKNNLTRTSKKKNHKKDLSLGSSPFWTEPKFRFLQALLSYYQH